MFCLLDQEIFWKIIMSTICLWWNGHIWWEYKLAKLFQKTGNKYQEFLNSSISWLCCSISRKCFVVEEINLQRVDLDQTKPSGFYSQVTTYALPVLDKDNDNKVLLVSRGQVGWPGRLRIWNKSEHSRYFYKSSRVN